MPEKDHFKEHQKIISKLLQKKFKDDKTNALSNDPDFDKICEAFKDSVKYQVGNYDSYIDLKKKFEKLAISYCVQVDIGSPLD